MFKVTYQKGSIFVKNVIKGKFNNNNNKKKKNKVLLFYNFILNILYKTIIDQIIFIN